MALIGRPVLLGQDLTGVILPSVAFNLVLIPAVYVLLGLLDRQTSRERLRW
jgi:hypothetical protein